MQHRFGRSGYNQPRKDKQQTVLLIEKTPLKGIPSVSGHVGDGLQAVYGNRICCSGVSTASLEPFPRWRLIEDGHDPLSYWIVNDGWRAEHVDINCLKRRNTWIL